MSDWGQAEEVAGKLAPVGAGFGFLLGLAASCFLTARSKMTAAEFFGIWLGGIALGTGAGAALGLGLVALGPH
jgi:hypothetical protein